MLLLNLNKIRTAHEKFEQVYQPADLGQESDFRVVAPVVPDRSHAATILIRKLFFFSH